MADTLLQTELADLDTSLHTLAGAPGVSISQLDSYPHLKEAYDRVRLGVSLLYDTNAYNELTAMLSRLPEPSSIRPDTLGSFLFGCRKVLNTGSAFCSPYCLESLLPPKSTAPVLCCPHQVYILSNGKLRHLNEVSSSSAQIYLADSNGSKVLTADQIATLQREGVTTAELLQLPPNNPGPATTLIPMSPVAQLNSTSLSPTATNPSTYGSIQPTRQASSWTWLWVIIIILILLLIAFAIWWAFTQRSPSAAEETAYTAGLFSPRV